MTPRKRFAVVETSLLREEWPDELRLACVLLLLTFADRWASDRLTAAQACTARLRAGELQDAMSATSLEAARARLRDLAEVVSLRVTIRGAITEVHWPKLAETQGWKETERKRDSVSARNHSGRYARSADRSLPLLTRTRTVGAGASASSSSEPSSTTQLRPGGGTGEGRAASPRAGRVVEDEPEEPEEPIELRVERTRARLAADAAVRAPRRFRAAVAGLRPPELEAAVHEARAAFVDGLAADPVAYFIGIAERLREDASGAVARERG